MTKLILLLLLADILDGVKFFSFLVSYVLFIGLIIWTLFAIEKSNIKDLIIRSKWTTAACVVFMLASAIIPSKHTVYIIAGGLAAGMAADSELGKKVLSAANAALDGVIDGAKK